MKWITRLFLSLVLCFITLYCKAQKIGLVLSGGGADGLSHIGVLKALEEEHIPVHYICGSSIGALLSAFYASGYRAEDLEKLVKSYFFEGLAKGKIPLKYNYLIKHTEDYGAWFSLKIDLSEGTLKNIPSTLINSSPIDFYLMEVFSPIALKSKYHFDSLPIPLRIVASDVEQKKIQVFKSGSLQDAVRSSITYPFYIRPIAPNGHLLFDGGLYNNFPVALMQREFNPDIIIGSNTTEKNIKPDDENIYSQMRTFLTQSLDSSHLLSNVFVIQLQSEAGTFNLNNISALIDSGYVAAKRTLSVLKNKFTINAIPDTLNVKKIDAFKSLDMTSIPQIDSVHFNGFTSAQIKFLTRHLGLNQLPVSYPKFRKRYFRLLNDDFLRYTYPKIKSEIQTTHLNITGKIQRPFQIEPGAIISNKPITETFLGVRYLHFGTYRFSAYANGYFGKLTSGAHVKVRIEPPSGISWFFEPSFTYGSWDYYNSSALFYDFQKPSYLLQLDRFVNLKIGAPISNQSHISAHWTFSDWESRYYNTDDFKKTDTADLSKFLFQQIQTEFSNQTLNRKMYSNEGQLFKLRLRACKGIESYLPGNQSLSKTPSDSVHNLWFQFKYTGERYFRTFTWFRLGIFSELLVSNQPFFKNYKSSLLAAPAFQPTPESQTLFISDFRAFNYASLGLKAIFNPHATFDLRTEIYIFQPYQSIINKNNTAELSKPFLYRSITATAALVYNSPIGPASLGLNYYEKQTQPFSLFFHLGFILFNSKSLD